MNDFLKKITIEKNHIISFAIILAVLLYLFSPFLFNGLQPVGVDSIASSGSTKLMKDYKVSSGERALWNPAIFCGMPAYPRSTPRLIHIDTAISYLGKISDWRFLYFLMGALGIFSYLRYLKIDWYWALTAALVFILLPHWQALIEVGHNTKLRAFMILPWLLFTFHYMYDKNSWRAAGLFAFIFSWLVRTQHFQVVFYGILLLFFIFIGPYIRLFMENKWKKAGQLMSKLIVAIVLTIITAAQPFITIKEYTPFSTRGGNAIKFEEEQTKTKNTKGVDFDYATRWSMAPKELLGFAYPRLFGGYSGETYDGKKFPHLTGRQIPGYWGDMPFTQSYDSVGMLILLLAIIGFYNRRKDVLAKAMMLFVIFAVFLAFGRHFPPLYKLLFNYMPYFSKFRVPSMINNATFLILIILAAMGLQSIRKMLKGKERNTVLGILASGFILSLFLYFIKNTFAFTAIREAGQYDTQTMAMIVGIRKEIFEIEVIKIMSISAGALIVALLYAYNRIKETAFIFLFSFLVVFELFLITNRANKQMNLKNRDLVEFQTFQPTEINQYLENAEEGYRVFTLGKEFQSNYYAYFYPMVSGYSAIKMQGIQDIIEHNLMNNGLNFPLINMLSAKYIITPQVIPVKGMEVLIQDKSRQELLILNNNAFPKAWLVDSLIVMESEEDIVKAMNSEKFDPRHLVMISLEGEKIAKAYNSDGKISLIESTPNKLRFSFSSTEIAYAVFSEMYYPFWKIEVQGKNIEPDKVNHILRGAELPAGNYEFEMVFHPNTYYSSLKMVRFGNILVLMLIIIPIVWDRRKKTKSE